MKAKKQQIVIEVRGGVIQGVYANIPGLHVRLLDWDTIEIGEDSGGMFPVLEFAAMPPSTHHAVHAAIESEATQ